MAPSTQSSRPLILYAEDTDAQRYAVSHVLRRAGFEVLEASTGRQALELMERRPDLVVLDVKLPDISGYEVCHRIKSSEASARVPVLHLSAALVTTQARVAGLEGGADAYLVQPVNPEELIATIGALLRVHRAEEELWVSKQQYRAFFEANPLACLVFDAADLRIQAVNAAAVLQYGHTREEFMRMTLPEVAVEAERETFTAFLRSDSASSPPSHAWKHSVKAGAAFTAETILAHLQLNDRDLRLLIVQDITEQIARQATEQREQLQKLLLERVLLAQEEERRHLARELHDHAGQLMTSLLVGLRTLSDARKLADAKHQAQQLREIASSAIGELGRLARGLHSTVIDDLGLQEGIQRHAEEFSAMHQIPVSVDFDNTPLSILKKDEQISIYRIVQEALTNVARHSQATRVNIQVKRSGADLTIIIADNGCGLMPSRNRLPWQHLGIEGMRQRAAMLGGSLELVSEPQQGLSVQARMPFPHSPTDTAE
jgi:PAS domain S-box-containing protein